MDQIEANIRASFRDVRLELISIKGEILKLAEGQQDLRETISGFSKKPATKTKKVKKSSKKSRKK